MPQKRAACKEIRKSKKKHLKNVRIISEVKTLIKRFDPLLSEKKLDQAKEVLKVISSKMNKAVTKGVIRKSTVSRKISRLSKKLHQAGGAKK